MESLKKLKKPVKRKGPLVFVVMDGIGIGPESPGNAVAAARTPVLDRLMKTCPYLKIKAHGRAVGLPTDEDMGNSEVGHNAIGAGRVFHQGARLVNEAIESGRLFKGETWQKLIGHCKENESALHFIGLLSDGNVHSHIDHLKAMLRQADEEGLKRVRIHILLDGRDVGERSALEYVGSLEDFLETLSGDYAIASGGGRMKVTMDRYEADWPMVERGWKAHVLGEGEGFSSAAKAIETFRKRDSKVTDQFLPAFVIHQDGRPLGPVQDGDAVIFFNFRGDRAIEISKAFEEDDFKAFDRLRRPDVEYAGMMEYDGDCHIPRQYLVAPPAISRTMSEYLAASGISQLACSETQKFGHVTYFWNGNRSGKFDSRLETYIEIPSDQVPFEQRPWMKSAEITDAVLEAVFSGKHRFIRLNYANGDMVGHTGFFDAAVLAVESVDLALGRLLQGVQNQGGVAIITADHGNADDMFEIDKQGKVKRDDKGEPVPKTSHSLNPVPLIVFDPGYQNEYRVKSISAGLSHLAATCMMFLGFQPPDDYDESLIEIG